MRAVFLTIFILILSTACDTSNLNLPTAVPQQATPAQELPPSQTPAPPSTVPAAIPSETTAATEVTAPNASPTATPPASPTPTRETSQDLALVVPPERDNLRLAIAFRGLDAQSLPTPAPVSEPLQLGRRETFTVLDVVNNRAGEIKADLLAVGDHSYFWFESNPIAIEPDPDVLAHAVARFDQIYTEVSGVFGSEANPGIDGDPRLHVLHASPESICGPQEGGSSGCGTVGFVSSADLEPAQLNPHSNEKEMFLMNGEFFGGDYYLGVLAHEFRHMIESNYSDLDTDWEKEGSAVLASELVGLPNSGLESANAFLANPDQQLNSWSETNRTPHYGQAYLFNRYLYDRLGPELYSEFATSALPGLVAVDEIASRHDLPFTAESLWLDWLAALVLHDTARAPQQLHLGVEGLQTAAATPVADNVTQLEGDVRQYGADYYELPAASLEIAFAGDEVVPLLAGEQAQDGLFWYAQRANYSNPRLTRAVDLRDADSATLSYDIYTDIELGYDFAYVSASTNGGQSWIPLTSAEMQGLQPDHDPSGSAYAERFYTGREQRWRRENIDLSEFAGQEILLRFEIVTDPILTYGGLAVDNVAVPEIGYRDDESGDGWTAEGFVLVPPLQPHSWHLQLITFESGEPIVTSVPVSERGRADFSVPSPESGARPVLIVSSAAPQTLSPSSYTLQFAE